MSETSSFQPVADVSTQRLARVYAEALLQAAQKRQQVDALFEELDSLIADVFQADPAFEVFLSSAAVGRNVRAQVIQKLFANRASELMFNFLMVLNDNERLGLLRAIRRAFQELNDERAHRARVQVTSAIPLPDDQRERLRQSLKETFQVEPILEAQVDPEVLGGLHVRIGDWVYDTSVRSRIENLRQQILARSSHEIQSGRDRFCIADGN